MDEESGRKSAGQQPGERMEISQEELNMAAGDRIVQTVQPVQPIQGFQEQNVLRDVVRVQPGHGSVLLSDLHRHSAGGKPLPGQGQAIFKSDRQPPVAAVVPMISGNEVDIEDVGDRENERGSEIDNNDPIAIDNSLNNDEDSQMAEPVSVDENETQQPIHDQAGFVTGMAVDVDSTTSDFEERPSQPTQKKKPKLLQFEDEEDDPDDPFKSEGTIYLEIDCFSQFALGPPETQQRLSKPIYVRGLPWKILAIPRETRETTKTGQAQKCLGFFLQCNGDSELVSWNCMASATLKVLGTNGYEDHKRSIAHTFYPKENDWGYSQFMTCEQLKAEQYCREDTVRLMVHVSADAPHGVQWDSKAHTGYIGLKNQGATCYMNSILQTFFFTNKLRKAVYEMPVSDEPPEANVGLAMQRVFYDLQYSDKPVGTKKLTKSFGWDSIETFMQHDVQELCRVLLDNLENKMKGTAVAETIPWLFKGKMKSFIKCTDVDFESSRVEDFYDIQLNIRSKHEYGRHQEISSPGFTLMQSFREYTEVERLDGDNKYDAGDYGMQPAEKGVKFVSFPPVLHLQLMRFQYDPQLDQNVKINDRFAFPDRLNLREFVDNPQGPDEDYLYILQAVLVHTGDFHGGHYVVFINTNAKAPLEGAKSRWCKFDDDVVSRAKAKDAITANYGGDDGETPNKTYTSAYMLVYVRESTISDVLCDVLDADIPDYLKQRFEAEKTEETRKKKEKSEAHLYTELSILTEDVLLGHHGFDLFDQVALEDVEKREKIEKKISFKNLYEVLADRIYSSENQKVAPTSFRLWKFEENSFKDDHIPISLSRLRPATLLPYVGEDSDKSLETALDSEKTILFLEEANLRTKQLPNYDDNSILMFFKYYDDLTQTLSVVGHLIVNFKKPLLSISDACCEMARISKGTKLKFYEEWTRGCVRTLSTSDLDRGKISFTDQADFNANSELLISPKNAPKEEGKQQQETRMQQDLAFKLQRRRIEEAEQELQKQKDEEYAYRMMLIRKAAERRQLWETGYEDQDGEEAELLLQDQADEEENSSDLNDIPEIRQLADDEVLDDGNSADFVLSEMNEDDDSDNSDILYDEEESFEDEEDESDNYVFDDNRREYLSGHQRQLRHHEYRQMSYNCREQQLDNHPSHSPQRDYRVGSFQRYVTATHIQDRDQAHNQSKQQEDALCPPTTLQSMTCDPPSIPSPILANKSCHIAFLDPHLMRSYKQEHKLHHIHQFLQSEQPIEPNLVRGEGDRKSPKKAPTPTNTHSLPHFTHSEFQGIFNTVIQQHIVQDGLLSQVSPKTTAAQMGSAFVSHPPLSLTNHSPSKQPVSKKAKVNEEEISADKIRYISTPEQPVCNEPVLAELVDGGLLIFERAEYTDERNNAKKYLESVYDRIDIEAIHNSDSFVGLAVGEESAPVNGVVCLSWLMKELVEYLGSLVNFDPAHILLWKLSQFNDRPTQYITDSQGKFMKVRDLLGLLGPHVHDPRRHKRYKVIYTKMPIRVDEMERRRQLKVQVMDDKMKVTEMTMFPEKTGTVASLLEEAVPHFKFASSNGSGKLRLVYVGTTLHQMRVFNVFPENTTVLEITQKALSPSIYAVRIEEIPVDQVDLKSGEMLIPVSHFDKDPQRMFGTPFFVKVVQDEPLCNIRERIQKMLEVPDKEFEKYKFALMANNRIARYLEMESQQQRVNLGDLGYNLSTGFQTSTVPSLASSPYLAIEHINKLRGSRGQHTTEKSIVIKN